MLAERVSLHDIEDVEGFVNATLNRSRISFSEAERAELVLEGMTILYDLAAKYEPQREGYDRAGRFSGFAAAYLPRRLGDVWHRLNEHSYATNEETGAREWVIPPSPVSLDSLRGGSDVSTPEQASLSETGTASLPSPPARPRSPLLQGIFTPLLEDVYDDVRLTLRVAVFSAAGHSREEIATKLGLEAEKVREASRRLDRITYRMRESEA